MDHCPLDYKLAKIIKIILNKILLIYFWKLFLLKDRIFSFLKQNSSYDFYFIYLFFKEINFYFWKNLLTKNKIAIKIILIINTKMLFLKSILYMFINPSDSPPFVPFAFLLLSILIDVNANAMLLPI